MTAPIGLIDTGINPGHGILAGAKVTVIDRPSAGEGSGAVHGTAVASLLIGDPGSRVPGLLPGATVLAVDVFSRAAGDERADAAALVEGLDLLAARGVRVYNLSLSGPPNAVLARMIDRLTDPAGLDALVVSAAGNGGPAADPAWPRAHPGVIAVTAVDARGRIYARAQRGDHLALAAPGVNLLAATSVRGARPQTGTSFAVPFVTAAAALALAAPGSDGTAAGARAALLAEVRDLGAPGPDPVFGQGLLQARALCP
ncbi:MAG: S8 family serine peptidase [Rhodobacterales bacterium]|nr:S8 family serine peptidase [Rhodobacterales bacterium]